MRVSTNTPAGFTVRSLDFFIVSFGRGEDNEIYVCTSATFRRDANDGAVHKLVPPDNQNLAQRAVVSEEEVPKQIAGPRKATQTATTEATTSSENGTETNQEVIDLGTTTTNETTEG